LSRTTVSSKPFALRKRTTPAARGAMLGVSAATGEEGNVSAAAESASAVIKDPAIRAITIS
jgi:hypothetical protein